MISDNEECNLEPKNFKILILARKVALQAGSQNSFDIFLLVIIAHHGVLSISFW